ncbi:hypothetical protein HYT56_04720 [Candidatus Woesearchaeota archaeon]|nr:hypothetical protein [Candidatus Woesearchaeota archaeon]
MSLIDYLCGIPRHMHYEELLVLEREAEDFDRKMKNKKCTIRGYSAGAILCISFLSLGSGFVARSLISKPISETHRIGEFYDNNNDGRYENLRIIKTYGTISSRDTSNVSGINFASPFGGELIDREWTGGELEGYFRAYNHPKVDEIRFIK